MKELKIPEYYWYLKKVSAKNYLNILHIIDKHINKDYYYECYVDWYLCFPINTIINRAWGQSSIRLSVSPNILKPMSEMPNLATRDAFRGIFTNLSFD